MKQPDQNELRSLDEIHRDIRRELERIEHELTPMVETGQGPGPEAMPEGFDSSCARLEQHVGELGRTLSCLDAVGPVDLSQLAARLLNEMLLRVEKPLVLRVSWAEGLPQTLVSAGPLRSLLVRVLDLVERFSASGDEITLETVGVDGAVAFRVSLQPADPAQRLDETFEQLSLRTSTMEEFVVDLGGEFELRQAGDAMCLEIRLPQEARRR